jgi:hypothetical protein
MKKKITRPNIRKDNFKKNSNNPLQSDKSKLSKKAENQDPESDSLSLLPKEEVFKSSESEDYKYNPLLNTPIAEFPDPAKLTLFYIEEFLSWLSNAKKPSNEDLYATDDYEIKYFIFPPDPEAEKHLQPVKTILRSIKNEELYHKRFTYEQLSYNLNTHQFLYLLLNAIQNNITEFLRQYAKNHSLLEHYPDPKNLERIFIKRIQKELQEIFEDDSLQLIPKLFHHRDHGIIMTCNISKPEDLEKPVGPDRFYEFGFSKETSNSFIQALLEILLKRQNLLDDLYLKENQQEKIKFNLNVDELCLFILELANEGIIAVEKDRSGKIIFRSLAHLIEKHLSSIGQEGLSARNIENTLYKHRGFYADNINKLKRVLKKIGFKSDINIE